MIELNPPGEWRELQERAARILRESGMTAWTDRRTSTARGQVDIDVFAVDSDATPEATILVECKHWRRAIPQTIVHAFRSIVADTGANLGLIVSSAGFQSGAGIAAEFTNLRLVDWYGFEDIFQQRWFENYMAPALRRTAEPLMEYTEPINTRVFRKADGLPETLQEQFRELRIKHRPLAFGFIPIMEPYVRIPLTTPSLPLRPSLTQYPGHGSLPDDALDATALRPLMDILIQHFEAALAEFDQVFGERA